ncbi:hypothetical protein [Frankia sp. AgB32]|uniref:hypothetical protein n=1 Tax=Frankia sp. AgB32 TaxID=631119 RepID=UPI00200C2155|nr:hypothetical protein [Frankia sp. AgB32]MCK9894698.1 hypothetical protein [Frankia sp. AgB32]
MIRILALFVGVLVLLNAVADDPGRSRRAPARAGRARPRTGRAALRDSRAMLASTGRAWRAATPAGRRWRTRTLAGNTARTLFWPDRRAPVRAAPRGPRISLVKPARTRAPLAHPSRTPAQGPRSTARFGGHMDLARLAQAAGAVLLGAPEGGLPGVPAQARAWAAALDEVAAAYNAWVDDLVMDVGLDPKPLLPLMELGDLLHGAGRAANVAATQIAGTRR